MVVVLGYLTFAVVSLLSHLVSIFLFSIYFQFILSIFIFFSAVDSRGTAGWRAPELRAGHADLRFVDVYALGLIIYHCLSRGGQPFWDKSFKRFVIEGLHSLRECDDNAAVNLKNLDLNMQGEALHHVCELLRHNPTRRYVIILIFRLFFSFMFVLIYCLCCAGQVQKEYCHTLFSGAQQRK